MRIVVVLAFLLTAAIAAWALWPETQQDEEAIAPNKIQIFTQTINNGMEVVVVPNDRVPAVSHTLWIRSGAIDEPLGAGGVAHYIEHLMFKGTLNVPEGEYSKRIVALGGNHNAFTGHDFTGYYVNIAKEHLATVMELEADRMQRLQPSDTAFEKELSVILEERQSRVDTQPEALFAERVAAKLFVHHPYGRTIIGWRHEMEQLTAKKAMDFMRNHYTPDNMVVVIAGDVVPEEAFSLARHYYGDLTGKRTPIVEMAEPPLEGETRFEMQHAQVRQARWMRMWQQPKLGKIEESDPIFARILLAEWLGSDRSSYLHRELVVKQKMASHIGVSYSGFSRGPGTFSISAIPAEGVSVSELENAIDQALLKLTDTFLTDENLAPYKTQQVAEEIFARDSLPGIGQLMGYMRMYGLSDDYIHNWSRYVNKVSAQSVKSALAELLETKGSVTAVLLPEAQPAPPVQPAPEESVREAVEEEAGL